MQIGDATLAEQTAARLQLTSVRFQEGAARR